jgi:hypothetical protein
MIVEWVSQCKEVIRSVLEISEPTIIPHDFDLGRINIPARLHPVYFPDGTASGWG